MNTQATALLLHLRLDIGIVRWIVQRLVLQLMPVIATYLERGGVAALSLVAMRLAQSLRDWQMTARLSGPLDQTRGYRNVFITKSIALIKVASSGILFPQVLVQAGHFANTSLREGAKVTENDTFPSRTQGLVRK